MRGIDVLTLILPQACALRCASLRVAVNLATPARLPTRVALRARPAPDQRQLSARRTGVAFVTFRAGLLDPVREQRTGGGRRRGRGLGGGGGRVAAACRLGGAAVLGLGRTVAPRGRGRRG